MAVNEPTTEKALCPHLVSTAPGFTCSACEAERQAEIDATAVLAQVRAGLDALALEAEGKYVIPGRDVVRRARTLAALCVVLPLGQEQK